MFKGIYNIKIDADGKLVCENSHLVRVDKTSGNEECIMEKLPSGETRCAFLLNIYQSEGKAGKVFG